MRKSLKLLPLMACLWACSGTKPKSDSRAFAPADSAAAVKAPSMVPEEQMLFSEVSEFVKLGQEGIKDSLWFQAGENFDSALVRLSALEATDSLSPQVYAHARSYRDSVQKLLIFSVAMSSQMSEPVPWTAQFNEEMEEVPDSSVKAMDSITHHIDPKNYTLPLMTPLDNRVLQAIAVFAGPGRGYFTKWLARKSRYEALVTAKLEARGMPKDLLYLAMVESGFNPKAWSKASASGLWQFISGTGRRYGLADDWWYDPRRDPNLATDAALEYLGDLNDEFQDWHKAMAAYNCGEGRIRRMMNQDSTRGYWDMPLPKETRFYVPKILAAMIIGHNPEQYGFKIEPEAPISFDTVTVSHCLTIATIAKSAGVSEDTILSLNPSLRRWCTPPNRVAHTLYLPTGTRDAFALAYEQLDKTQLVNWRHHIVAKGENISAIAAKYRVSVAAIKATNKIKGNRLSRGQSLLIPLAPQDAGKYLEQDVAEVATRETKFKGGTYRVRSGDNLFDIARRFGTTVSALLAANNMKRGSLIHAGQKLRLTGKAQAGSTGDEPESHREPAVALVARDKGRSKAADEDKPVKAEDIEAPDPGATKGAKARGDGGRTVAAPAAGRFGVHTVGAGESIYSISRALGVDEDDLRHWNGLNGNRIQTGQKLKYLAPKTANEPERLAMETSADDDADGEGVAPGAASLKGVRAARAPVAAAGFMSPPEPKDEKQYYVVKDGDSLWDISVKYRSTVQKLKDLNGRMPSVLRAGTRIRVK